MYVMTCKDIGPIFFFLFVYLFVLFCQNYLAFFNIIITSENEFQLHQFLLLRCADFICVCVWLVTVKNRTFLHMLYVLSILNSSSLSQYNYCKVGVTHLKNFWMSSSSELVSKWHSDSKVIWWIFISITWGIFQVCWVVNTTMQNWFESPKNIELLNVQFILLHITDTYNFFIKVTWAQNQTVDHQFSVHLCF